jgi:hypothetical protein
LLIATTKSHGDVCALGIHITVILTLPPDPGTKIHPEIARKRHIRPDSFLLRPLTHSKATSAA